MTKPGKKITDTQRINYLSRHCYNLKWFSGLNIITDYYGNFISEGKTVRKAIDAAMRAERSGK